VEQIDGREVKVACEVEVIVKLVDFEAAPTGGDFEAGCESESVPDGV
jgi:hypothetical protein